MVCQFKMEKASKFKECSQKTTFILLKYIWKFKHVIYQKFYLDFLSILVINDVEIFK